MSYDLEKAAKHVVHDYTYLVVAGNDTQQPLANPFNHYAERTFLVHCRAFAGFFSGKGDNRDMFAHHFVDGSFDLTVGAWRIWHDHLDKHLMHLSQARIENQRPWTGDDNKLILEGFQGTWQEFYNVLKPSVKPAFEAELEIMQKQYLKIQLR